jgi:hypothetical protein
MEDTKTASFPKRRKYETTTEEASFSNDQHVLEHMSSNKISPMTRMNSGSSSSSGVNSGTPHNTSTSIFTRANNSIRLSQVELECQMIQNELGKIKSSIMEVASKVEENFVLISNKLNQHTNELLQNRSQMPIIPQPSITTSNYSPSSIVERLNNLETMMKTMLMTEDSVEKVGENT